MPRPGGRRRGFAAVARESGCVVEQRGVEADQPDAAGATSWRRRAWRRGRATARPATRAGARAAPDRAPPGGPRRPRTASAWSITPAAMPEQKSRCTRSATASERRSASKRSRSRPSSSARAPQVRVVEAALVAEERVVHLPEAPLERRGLGGAGQPPRARVLGDDGEVAEDPPHGQRGEQQVGLRAVRALVVAVLDDDEAALAADVVLGARAAGGRGATQPRRARRR